MIDIAFCCQRFSVICSIALYIGSRVGTVRWDQLAERDRCAQCRSTESVCIDVAQICLRVKQPNLEKPSLVNS